MPSAKLTQAEVKAATYPLPWKRKKRNRTLYIWDREQRGFGLRVFPSGLKTFVITYRHRETKTKRFLTIGPCPPLGVTGLPPKTVPPTMLVWRCLAVGGGA